MSTPVNRPRLRRKEVPEYLKDVHGIDIAVTTLNKLASIGGGPVMRYVGRIPLYDKTALDEWAEQRLGPLVSTSMERGLL